MVALLFTGLRASFLMTKCKFSLSSSLKAKALLRHSINHRMLGIGSDLKKITQSNRPARTGTLRVGHTEAHPGGFWIPLEKKIPQLPWAVGSSVLSPSQWKSVFLLHVSMELSMPQIPPIAPYPVMGHHREEPGPILLALALCIFINSP